MDIDALSTGIYNVFLANSDLKTALGGNSERRLYDGEAPQNPTSPYAVFQYIAGDAPLTFTSIAEVMTWQFSIFHESEDPLDTATIDDVVKKLTAAYDDATLTVSGYTSIAVTRGASYAVPPIDNTQQFVINYEVIIEVN